VGKVALPSASHAEAASSKSALRARLAALAGIAASMAGIRFRRRVGKFSEGLK
jgi:hypothetical protein